ncbi:hypothetical protein DWB77_07429 [Streptomyces hundungensis]|uniref:Uncharacterized protein n=1 Tax=Streptomyces hundungensis TaxID=1077946 RepID=A0A387HSN8_9ACTN|nr:hypothetical protein DWB77_07429 [Streptomyces hundungensis]
MIISTVTVAQSRLKMPVIMARRPGVEAIGAGDGEVALVVSASARSCAGRISKVRTPAAAAVSRIEVISQVSPRTPRLLAVARPKRGTAIPIPA